jgi:hypothetical protein
MSLVLKFGYTRSESFGVGEWLRTRLMDLLNGRRSSSNHADDDCLLWRGRLRSTIGEMGTSESTGHH